MKELWVEQYRPKTIEECILPKRIKDIFKGYIEKKEIPNLILSGSQGLGKTSVARAIINELGAEYLFVDASSDNGKAMLETTLEPFAQTISMVNMSVPKIALLDEADGLTLNVQRAFRPFIEAYNKSTRFIFTCNFPERIIKPIKSRCACFDFTITNADKSDIFKQFVYRCKNILDENNVTYDERILAMFVAKHFPDFRRVINELQSYASAHNVIDEGIMSAGFENDIADNLYPLIKSCKFNDVRKWIGETVSSPEDIFNSLYKRMNDYVPKEKQPELVLKLAEYQFYSSSVMNQNINLMALMTELMSILYEKK